MTPVLAALAGGACARPIMDDAPASRSSIVATAPTASGPVGAVQTFRLNLVYLAGSEPPEFMITLDDSLGFRTVDALERFLEGLPAGTVLDWDPGCERRGNEPLLSDPRGLDAFRGFCARHGLRLVVHPGG